MLSKIMTRISSLTGNETITEEGFCMILLKEGVRRRTEMEGSRSSVAKSEKRSLVSLPVSMSARELEMKDQRLLIFVLF